MAVVAAWQLKNSSTASVYSNGTDTSMSYSGSNAIFSGSGYIEVNDGTGIIHGTSGATIECYAKVTGSGDQFIMAGWEWGGFILKNNASNLIETALYTNAATFNSNSTGVTGNDGKWHHIVMTYDGSNKVSYVDGIQKHSIAQTGTIRDNGGGSPRYIQFGANRQAGPTYNNKLTGGITEGRIDSTGLSATYVKNRFTYLTGHF